MKSHYVSVPLTAECRAGLKAVQEALADDAEKLNFRRSGIDDAHFTFSVFRLSNELRQRYASEEQMIESSNKVLKDFLEKRPPTELAFGGLGSFGSRIFFIHIANETEVGALRDDVNEVLKNEGLILADDRFTPHVTLYRARDGRRGRRGSRGDGAGAGVTVNDMVQRTDLPPVASSPVSQLVLQRMLG